MFKTKRGYNFSDISKIPEIREYKIGVNDNIQIIVVPNKGGIILETNQTLTTENPNVSVVVEYDGTIKLPVLGRIYVKDLTVREAELLLEERYKEVLVDPFVNLKILNKRVLLFKGDGGMAAVIPLINQNTTLTEVIAQSGGILANGKADRIKLIRGDPKNPEVYLIDLSHIDGISKGDIVLQGNDIVYIEPRNDLIANFAKRATAYTFVASLFILYFSILK